MVSGPLALAKGSHCGAPQDAPMLAYALMRDYTFERLMCPPLPCPMSLQMAHCPMPPTWMKMLHFEGGEGRAVTCMPVTPMAKGVMA